MKYIFIILAIALHFTVSAQVVQNVRFEQNGEEIIVYYDLDKLGYRTATKEWRIKEIA